jgi:uncharacterized protein (UPF0261 family)
MATIAVMGTLDSKGYEHEFLANEIKAKGHRVCMIDLGTGQQPCVKVDVTRYEVAKSIDLDLEKLIEEADRGNCVRAMSKAAAVFLKQKVEEGVFDAVISLGGGGGTSLASNAMRALPLGFPKIIVSTLASGNTAHYLGTKDITLMPSIVDVAGLNRVSKMVFQKAAAAICGMVEVEKTSENEKPLIVASMFGNTTDCVNMAKTVLEDAGYEVLVFHATGMGGRSMEDLIESGMVHAVLDITTTEWADEITGGVLSAGSSRLDAMSKAGVPALVVPGCLDMANFGEKETVPEKFKDRVFYQHNDQVTLMRTNTEECEQLGEILAEKANQNSAPTEISLPLHAVSVISAEGQKFYDKDADQALFKAIKQHAKVKVHELPYEINDREFAEHCAHTLLNLIEKNK